MLGEYASHVEDQERIYFSQPTHYPIGLHVTKLADD